MENDGVWIITSINGTRVGNATSKVTARISKVIKTSTTNDGVCTIIGINGTVIDNAPGVASTSNYVIAITSGDVFGIGNAPAPVLLDISGVSTSDYVIAIASIHKSRVANTVGRTYAIANYYVVTLIGIEGALAV